jgi:hypothetical protein
MVFAALRGSTNNGLQQSSALERHDVNLLAVVSKTGRLAWPLCIFAHLVIL